MSKTIPVTEFRSRLTGLLYEVTNRGEHVTVTRRGQPVAVLVPVDEYARLEESVDILSDEGALTAIRQGLEDVAAEDVVAFHDLRTHDARP